VGSIDSNPNFVLGYYYRSKLIRDRGGYMGWAVVLARLVI
jgi:hypothetical protein